MATADDPWVVISGAGGALGSMLGSHFASQGRRVLGLDRTFGTAAPVLGMTTRTVDLLADADVNEALREVIPPGDAIALLINAVGQIWNEPILSFQGAKLATHSLATWRSVIDANLTAPFVVATQIATRMMRRGGGSIVNFSSIVSDGNAGQAAYAAAKAGIEGLTRAMAIELGPLGVRVNALALGFIDAPTTRSAVGEERLKSYVQKTPLGRLGEVEDVINAIEFLATNGFANGTIVKLDGGLRL